MKFLYFRLRGYWQYSPACRSTPPYSILYCYIAIFQRSDNVFPPGGGMNATPPVDCTDINSNMTLTSGITVHHDIIITACHKSGVGSN